METTRFSFCPSEGWSIDPLPELDSESTLITVFGAPSLKESKAFAELRAAYPNSIIVGCSTSGEIHQDEIRDKSLSVGVARFEKTRLQAAWAPIESGAMSEEAKVTCSTSSTENQRSNSTRPTLATALTVCLRPACSSHWR